MRIAQRSLVATSQPSSPASPRAATAPAAPAPKAPVLSRSEALDRIQRFMADEQQLKDGTHPSGLRLQPNYESIFKAHPAGQAKGTVVLYHGFTAGPWQYTELAEKLFAQGYDVYAPRMPGHGLMTPEGKATAQEVPRAHERGRYEAFVDDRFAEAHGLGGSVYMVGLSGGGNLALRTAEKHPEVKGTVAMAPYVGPGKWYALGTHALALLDTISFGLFKRLFNKIPHGKNEIPSLEDLSPHTNGSFGQAWAIRAVGGNLEKIQTPVQFLTTEGDFLSGKGPVGKLLARSGGDEKHGWYHFRKEDKVPHAMVSKRENPQARTVEQIDGIILDFIRSGKQADRWP
jgi:esterase/lipase